MGAKQSKRSVDISGKEAESGGEVAAAGAGGEGRVEPLADADALKPQPQPNGDAHIHDTPEKEKQLDSGTPEIEKDATTEKEIKEQEENEKEKEVPVTNGESEPKAENGESTPSPDDGKKNKKEKVKKKWSLRSISFSRKDKPKQEKKQKDEEAKTNGEPEKVPEEVAETTPEVDEVTKSETENKDEKTPETPVTEPLTNGSSTPESPKVETPIVEESKNEIENEVRLEPKVEAEAEKLPVNGLSLEESKKDEPEVPEIDSNKTEESKIETTESVPVPEIPVAKEVCVDQTPLIESTPPPLPANPPPSSVASFAATTMAPELSDASSPANNADIPQNAHADESPVKTENTNDTVSTEPQSTETIQAANIETEVDDLPVPQNDASESQAIDTTEPALANEVALDNLPSQDDHEPLANGVIPVPTSQETIIPNIPEDQSQLPIPEPVEEQVAEITDSEDILPPPPVQQDVTNDANSETPNVEQDSVCETKESEVDASVITQNEINERSDITISESLKIKAKDIVTNVIENGEAALNGVGEVMTNGDRSPPPPAEQPAPPAPAPAPAAPGATHGDLQDPAPIADKIADLIPEIPTVPEINTEMETTTDVAVAN